MLPLVLPFRDHTRSIQEGLIYFSAAAAFLLMAHRLYRGVRPAYFPIRPILDLPIALFAITAIVSAAFSMSPDFSRHELRAQLLKMLLIFFAVSQFCATPGIRRFATGSILLAGALSAAYGLLAYYTGKGIEAGRATGSLVSYTRSAMYFILWMPLALSAVLWGARAKWERILLVGAIALAWWFVLVTQSRGPAGAIAIGAFALLAARNWKWCVIGLCALAVSVLAIPSSHKRLETSIRSISKPDEFLSQRLNLWRVGLRATLEHPWVGIGYGSDIFQMKSVRPVYRMKSYKLQPDAHQFYLQVSSEGGLAHLAALLAFFGGAIYLFLKALRRGTEGDKVDRFILSGALVGIATMLLYGLVGHFHENHIAFMMWYMVGLGYCASNVHWKREKS